MKLIAKVLIAAIAVCGFGLVGCYEEGPAERAGEDVDRATERAGEKMEDATDRAADRMEDAGDKIEDETRR